MKWRFSSVLSIFCIIIIIIALFYTGNISYKQYEAQVFGEQSELFPPPTGKLQPVVVDGYSEMPLENATVVIPETGERYVTDENGKTPVIEVPILEDTHFSSILKKPWGEITLLIYKEGYIEYALFHTQVWENQVRSGPKILLFPKDSEGSNEPFSLIEGPHRLWVNELVEKYRK